MKTSATTGRVAVIGAGPAGLSAGYGLAKRGVQVDVYEAGPAVGGLARTLTLWNQKVDVGPQYFFSNDPRISKLWFDLVGSEYSMIERREAVLHDGRLLHTPPKLGEIIGHVGLGEAAGCFNSYLSERFHATELKTLEQGLVHRFGRRVYENYLKPYNEKLWDVACEDLEIDFADQALQKLSLGGVFWNAILGLGQRRDRHLASRIAYPHGGSGVIYDRMADHIAEVGGRIFTNAPVTRVVTTGRRATGIELEDGQVLKYDHIVSTMPVSHLVSRLPGAPIPLRAAAQSLQFRNTIFVYVKVDSDRLFPQQCIYVPDPSFQTGRITNYRNWVPELYGSEPSSVLALEYWCYDTDMRWKECDLGLLNVAGSDLRRSGLIGDAAIGDGCVYRVPRTYPVYRRAYQANLKPVEEYLANIEGLTAIGRYGSFKYNTQDHSLLMGELAARNIAEGTLHNLWQLDTDYDDNPAIAIDIARSPDRPVLTVVEGGAGRTVDAGDQGDAEFEKAA